jgi:hypothetical protein
LLLNRQFIAIGKDQDGGLGHNMPARLALWEAGEIWSSVVRPDALLSLGNGVGALKKDLQPVQAWSVGQVIKDWSIPRLFRFLMSKTDTRKAWQELWNSLDEKSRQDYFRFNAFFSGPEPALDNTDCMDDLSRSVPL